MKSRFLALFMATLLLAAVISPSVALAGAATDTLSNNVVSEANVTHTVRLTTAVTVEAAVYQPNKVIVTLLGQNLSAVTPLDVWTNNIPGVGSITVDAAAYAVTVPFTGGIGAGTEIVVQIAKVTNQATAGNTNVTIDIQRDTTGTPTYVSTDSGSATVTYVDNVIQNQVRVAKSMEVTISGPRTYTYAVDPVSRRSVTEPGNTITVKTNADSYTVTLKVDNQMKRGADPSVTIPAFAGTFAAPAPWGSNDTGFGYTLSGANAANAASWTGPKYAGFSTTGDAIMSSNAPTGDVGHTVTVGYKLAINYSVKAGTYSNTITYVITPVYN